MSLRAMAWAKGLTADPHGHALKMNEKFVLLILADYHNDHQNIAWPDKARLACECLISKRTLDAVLTRLVDHGLVAISRNVDALGIVIRNSYTFPTLPFSTLGTLRDAETAPLSQDVGGAKSSSLGSLRDADSGCLGSLRDAELAVFLDTSYEQEEEEKKEKRREEKTPPAPPQAGGAVSTPQGVDHSDQASVEWILSEWGTIEGVLHPVRLVPGHGIDKAISAKLKKHPQRAWWLELFAVVAASPHLCGRREPLPGRTCFRATLGWVLLPNNLAKTLEGTYLRRPGDRPSVRGKFSPRGSLEWAAREDAKDAAQQGLSLRGQAEAIPEIAASPSSSQ